jgi:hypothetical protein
MVRAPRAMPVRRGVKPGQMTAAPPSAHAPAGLVRPRAGARPIFWTAGTAFLCIAVFLAVLGPCLCPPPAEGDGHGCCPKPGFNAAAPKEACCVGPATPPAFVEATGQWHLWLAAIAAPTTFANNHASFAGLSRPPGPHPARGALPPLLNLRI